MPAQRLFLIDANALCYRSYYAIKGLANSKGQATNAVFGFTSTLKKILREFHPNYMAVCFDVGAKTNRQKKYAQYKIQRPPMPDDLVSQMPLIKRVVAAYQLPVLEQEGFEADDVIATIVEKMRASDIEVVIVSDDKDMFQLIGERVQVFSIRHNKFYTPLEVKAIMGVDPKFIPDFIGLAGDKVDNIPGVKGIGEMSAQILINKFGSLEEILSHIEEVKPPRIKQILHEQKDQALFSKGLAILERDMALDLKLSQMQVAQPDIPRLRELFHELEFHKFASELSGADPAAKQVATQVIKTEGDLKKLTERIRQAGRFAFLIESTQEEEQNFLSPEICLSLGGEEVYRITEKMHPGLQTVLNDLEILKITQDIKDQLKQAAKRSLGFQGKVFDCLLAGYLLLPSRPNNDIPTLAWQYLKLGIPENDSLPLKALALGKLYEPLSQELREKDLLKLLTEIELPLAGVLSLMEREGVRIDEKLLKKLSKESDQKIKTLMDQLFQLAGKEFNLNSPKQLSEVLFNKLQLPVMKKTKTGFSTNEEVLTKLADQHPFPALLLEYRQLAKLKSTYIDALPKLMDPKTHRIHASFNQAGTETGRLSSNNPNLQNIPIRTELGRQIRKAFIASENDRWIISADYSQIELRILAHLSGDENLIQAFLSGQDIHQVTAAKVFGVAEKDVTPEMRHSAKRVNFGIIYGMSAFGLAKDLNIPQPQAQEFIDKYFLRYPKVKTFMDQSIKLCEEHGYVVTLLQRRRYIPEINSSNMGVKQMAQRQAINTPVQGSAADLIKLAMVNIQRDLEQRRLKSRMIITVHDELVFDVTDDEIKALVTLVRERMEHPVTLKVPITVSIKKGRNWLEMERI
jgi:DNA polymerase I